MDSEKCGGEYPTTIESKGIVKTISVHCKGMMKTAGMMELRCIVACGEVADRKQKMKHMVLISRDTILRGRNKFLRAVCRFGAGAFFQQTFD